MKTSPGFAGLGVGFVAFAAIIPLAPATGARMNLARSTGPMLVQPPLGKSVQWENWPTYVVAELQAGVSAARLFGLNSRPRAHSTTLTEALTAALIEEKSTS